MATPAKKANTGATSAQSPKEPATGARPDGGLRHLLGGVCTRGTVARDQPVNRPALDSDIRIPHNLSHP